MSDHRQDSVASHVVHSLSFAAQSIFDRNSQGECRPLLDVSRVAKTQVTVQTIHDRINTDYLGLGAIHQNQDESGQFHQKKLSPKTTFITFIKKPQTLKT